MKLSLWSLCLPVITAFAVPQESTFTPTRPPAIPLAVKSPYLSAWIRAGSDGGNGGLLAGSWPVHWSGKIVGWAGIIRVDGEPYQWLGNPGFPNVQQTSFEYTSTKSIFQLSVAGKVALEVTFLSPVTPDDLQRQSLVGSYMEVSVRSIDGAAHDVQLYSDISAEWVSGDRDVVAKWRTDTLGNMTVHRVWRDQQIEFDESDKPDGNGMANWGTVWYATDQVGGVTWQTGSDQDCRQSFAKVGRMANTQDKKFRQITDNWPVFALAKDLGRVGTDPNGMLFSIGLSQAYAAQFLGDGGLRRVPSLWTQYFKTDKEAIAYFHSNSHPMRRASEALDMKVLSDAVTAGGENLAMITTLTVRQSFGATQLVGTIDKPYLFLKEISSNGNTQTVDVVFPMHPILLYTNPKLLKLLLDPLFEQQESGHWPHKFAIHDLGYHYPNFTGHANGESEEMPVEECGNMIIMTAAYAKWSKDYDYLNKHYPILQQWTQFLINDSLIPANQLSTDDFAGKLVNQTNLALKGIIGIKAMAVIADNLNRPNDRDLYNSYAQNYIQLWQSYGIAHGSNPPHTSLNYGNDNTHGLLYNLWTDTELGLNLVPDSVYTMQSKFYQTQRNKYGVPLDTRHTWTKSDWLLFVAGTTARETSDMIISDIVRWLKENPTSLPMTDLYDTNTGGFPGIEFKARPVMGAAFAPLLARRY